MAVKLARVRGRHRIIDLATGMPAVNEGGQPVDNGGRKGKLPGAALKQQAIEINEAERDA